MEHPITPPPELVQQWNEDAVGTHFSPYGYSKFIAVRAAQWGADQELEACYYWIENYYGTDAADSLQQGRPQSLKEQALGALEHLALGPDPSAFLEDMKTIRRALEALDD